MFAFGKSWEGGKERRDKVIEGFREGLTLGLRQHGSRVGNSKIKGRKITWGERWVFEIFRQIYCQEERQKYWTFEERERYDALFDVFKTHSSSSVCIFYSLHVYLLLRRYCRMNVFLVSGSWGLEHVFETTARFWVNTLLSERAEEEEVVEEESV